MRERRELYRIPEKARIAGVCAGIAEYFGIEVWLVRILTVSGFFLLAAPFVFVAYVAAWFILEKRPGEMGAETKPIYSQAEGKGWKNTDAKPPKDHKVEVKTKVWQAGEPPRQALHDIAGRFNKAEKRLRKIETYVTSREYQLNREISRL